jgi:hypothetical protein
VEYQAHGSTEVLTTKPIVTIAILMLILSFATASAEAIGPDSQTAERTAIAPSGSQAKAALVAHRAMAAETAAVPAAERLRAGRFYVPEGSTAEKRRRPVYPCWAYPIYYLFC